MSLVFGDVEITNNISGVGLSSRRPARTATTIAGTLSTSFANGQVIDNITLVTGDRILIKNQVNPIQNGVYEVQASGSPIRTPDYSDGDAVSGASIFIQEGVINNGTEWLCISISGSDIVNTDPLEFKLTSGDVSGQGISTDNAIPRWDGTTGTYIQDSSILIDDSNNMTGLQYIQFSDITAPSNPADGEGRLYKKTGNDGFFWLPDSAGTEVDLTTKTVIVQDQGTNITGTPHTTFNFTGNAVVAADAGSGVADITISAVTTFSGDTTGLTPSTVTSGDVVLGGTLNATHGGTGQNIYAVGDILYADTTTTLMKLPKPSVDSLLTMNASGDPAWGNLASYLTFVKHEVIVKLNASPGTFTSVADAIASIPVSPTPDFPTATNQWIVRVHAGTYYEPQLVVPEHVLIVGTDMQGVQIYPSGLGYSLFKMRTNSGVAFISNGNTDPNYPCFDCDNCGDFVLLHKVTVNAGTCDRWLSCVTDNTATDNSIVYLEYCDTTDSAIYTILAQDTNIGGGFGSQVTIENFFTEGHNDDSIIVDGLNTSLLSHASEMASDGTGNCIHVKNGAMVNIRGMAIISYTNGILVDNDGSVPRVFTTGIIYQNCTNNVVVNNNNTLGHLDGYTEYGKTFIPKIAPLFITNKDQHIITVGYKGTDFSSIAAALAAITDNSFTNRYTISVNPGTYVETQLQLKPYVTIQGLFQTQCLIVAHPSVVGTPFIKGAGYAALDKLTFAVADYDYPPSYMVEYLGDPAGVHFRIDNSVFDTSGDLIHVGSTAGPCIFLLLNTIINMAAPFTNGILIEDSGPSNYPISYIIDNLIWNADTVGLTNFNNLLTIQSYSTIGINVFGAMTNSSIGQSIAAPVGTGVVLEGFVYAIVETCILGGFSVGYQINSSAYPTLGLIASTTFSNNTMDIDILSTNSQGTITCNAALNKVNITTGSNFGVTINDPSGSVILTGQIYQGVIWSEVTNITEQIQHAAVTGSVDNIPIIAVVSGLNVSVTGGAGYTFLGPMSNDYLHYTVWSAVSSLTLPDNSLSWIYVDGAGVVSSSTSRPNYIQNVILGTVKTYNGDVTYIQLVGPIINNQATETDQVLRILFGPVVKSGCIASPGSSLTSRAVAVSSGSYYLGSQGFTPGSNDNVTMIAYHGGTVETTITQVPLQWDNAGTLTSISSGKWIRHQIYLIGDLASGATYFLVYGQQEFNTEADADSGPNPSPPTSFVENMCPICCVVVTNTDPASPLDISRFIDTRPIIGSNANNATSSNDHNSLSNLTVGDAHPQYFRTDGTRVMTGNIQVGTSAITWNVPGTGVVDGVTITNHGARHLPGGADPLATAAPVSIGSTNQLGAANSFARSDHVHQGVLSFSAGTTGLTPNTATFGAVTLAGTLIAVNGGTGFASYTVGDLLFADTTTTFAKLEDVATGNVLLSGGIGVAPLWGKVSLSTAVNGVLPVANGGTAISTTPTNGQLLIGNGTNYTLSTLTAGTAIGITNASGSITINNTGVTSISGTANQVTASASTGTVTLSTPSVFIAPGTIQDTTGMLYSTSAVSAAGTTQGTATALTRSYVVVTTAAVNSGVVLPTPASAGYIINIINRGANAVNVYPASGGTIDTAAANAAISLPVGSSITLQASSTTQWFTVNPPLVAGTAVSVVYGNGRTTLNNTGVTSIAGTANQVTMSAATGAVTASTPAIFIAPGTIKDTTGMHYSTNAAVSAAGTTQGTATLLTTSYNVVSTVAAGSGVVLPLPAATGYIINIVNRGANPVNIYPNTGDVIDSGVANAAISLPVNATITLQASTLGQWYTVNPPLVAGIGTTITYGNGRTTVASSGLVNVHDEGSAITGTPHSTLNFVGPRVTASDAGGGVATITIPALLTTKGDIFTYDTAETRLAVGSNDQSLIADSTTGTGLKWAAIVNSNVAGTGISVSGATGNVTITNTGVTSLTTNTGLSTNVSATGAVTVTNTGVLSWSGGTTGLTPNSATTGAIVLGGTLIAVNGGTGFASYAVGDLLYADTTTTLAKLADVATGNVLLSGGVGVAPLWGKVSLSTAISGVLPVVNGGTALSTTPTNGQLLIGNGSSYTLATLTPGTAIGITNASGSITINNTGVTSLTTNTGLSTNVSATGAVTVTNTGVLTFTSNTGLSSNVSATGNITVTNTGVLSNVAGTGISVSGSTGNVTITNTGVTSLTGTANQVTVSASTGSVTLSTPSVFIAPGTIQDTTGMLYSTNGSVSAAGTNQATATGLTRSYNVVTTVASGSGVSLPTPAAAGYIINVVNKGANALLVYPATGGTIDSAALNAGVSLPVGASITYQAASTTQWYSINPPIIAGSGTTVTYGNGATTVSGSGLVNVQDEGSAIAGTPHTTLNFVGSRVTASNAGGGVATITIPALLTTKGDIFTYDTVETRLAVGTNNQALIADSTTGTGLRWAAIVNSNVAGTGISVSGATGNVTITNTGVTSLTTNTGLSLNASATGAVTVTNTGVLNWSAGTTGLTPNTATTGVVTLGGTLIAVNGGTGFASYAIGDLLYADTTTTLAKLPDVAPGNVLISGGVNTAPLWGKVSLTTAISGVLPIANGGTALSTTPTNGQLLIGNGTNYTLATLTAGTAIGVTNASGSITINNIGVTSLTTNTGLSTNVSATGAVTVTNTGVLTFTSNTGLSTNVSATGNISVTNTGVLSNLAGVGISVSGATGNVTITNTGVTSLTTNTGLSVNASATGAVTVTNTGVLSWSAGTTGLTPSVATTGAVVLAGTLIAVNGGTGFASYVVGDLLFANTTTTLARLADVATGNVLISGGVGVAPLWGKVSLTTAISGVLPIANGGTALSTTPTNGQLLIGNGTNYTLATLTAGTAIGITNASGSITINNTGVTSLTTNTGLSTNVSATGAVTVTNTGVLTFTSNTGLSTNVSATGNVTVTNTGVLSNVAGTGISVSGATGNVTITNAGVTSLTGTANQVTVSASTGSVTLSTPPIFTAPGSIQDSTGMLYSTNGSVSAAGTNQVTATSLIRSYNVVTTVASGTGVALPTPGSAGYIINIVNRGANALLVYPATGGTIDSAGLNTGVSLPVGASITYQAASTTQWYSINPPIIAGTGTTVTYGNGATTVSGSGLINVQDEGSAIAGTPHTTLNFVGSRVTASNAGGGVATITIPALLTTKGDIFTYDTAETRLGVGSNDEALIADSTTGTGLKWAGIVNSNVAGTGISVSGATGNVIITNTGVTSLTTNTGLSVNASATGAVTVTNTGVLSWSAGTTGLTPSVATTGAVVLAGTLIAVNGGTGFASYVVGDLLFANTTTTLARLADVATGNVLISGGVGVAPAWGKVSLTTAISGILPVANGGTALSTTPTNGQLLIGNGTNYTLATLTAGTAIGITNASGSITINNTGVTSLTTNTGLSTNVSATGAVTVTNTGVLSNVAGTGISVSGATGNVTITNTGVTSLTTNTGLSTNVSATGAVTVTNTGVLSWSAGTTGLTPNTATTGAVTLGGTLIVGNGGTGATTLTSNGVIFGNGTSAVGVTAAGTTGQVLIGTTGSAPSWSALSGLAVTALTGTANQVSVSASTGSVTLSTPSVFIAPGTIQDTTGMAYSTSATVSAAGTNQATATQLTTSYNILTTVASGTGVILPAPSTIGYIINIVNRGANPVNIYPTSTDQIDGLAASLPVVLPVNATITLQAASLTRWFTVNPPIVGGTNISVAYGNGQTTVNSTAGIFTLNTLTPQTQTMVTGTAGTSFNIASASSTHTFNLPSASETNTGVITNTPQTIKGGKTFVKDTPLVSFIGSAVNSGTNVSSLTINVPSGTTTTDMLMLAFITVRNGFSRTNNSVPYTDPQVILTPPAGWVLVNQTTNIINYPRSIFIYIKPATVSEPTNYTWGGISPGPSDNDTAAGTATFATNVMTITAVGSGTFTTGQVITATGVTPGTTITAFGTGNGGTGTYTLSTSPGTLSSRAVSATKPKTNFVVGGISTFSNVSTYNSINVLGSQATPSSLTHTTPTNPPVITTTNNTLLLTYYSMASVVTSWTLNSGQTTAANIGTGPTGPTPPQAIGESMVQGYLFNVPSGTLPGYSATASNDADAGLTLVVALRQSSEAIITAKASTAAFSAVNAGNTIIGTTLTVTGAVTGAFDLGMIIGGGTILSGTTIVAFGTGTGGTGTYTVNPSQTTTGTFAITGVGQITNMYENVNAFDDVLSGFDTTGQPFFGGTEPPTASVASNAGNNIIAGTLTVAGAVTGALSIGMLITGGTIVQNTRITAFGTGTGGTGTYTVSPIQTTTGGAFAINGVAASSFITLKTETTPLTSSYNVTVPSANTLLVGTDYAATLTNKTMTSNTNNVIARELWVDSGASSVSTYAATAPTVGQVLTATTSTTATWQTPSGGGSSIIVKEQGTNIPNTPHTSLNFIGPGITATDGGAGVADITLIGGYTNAIVTTTNGTATTIATIATASNITYLLDCRFVARRTNVPGTGAGYIYSATFRNVGGTLTRIGQTKAANEDVGGWDVNSVASGTNILLQVIGAGGSTINWKVNYSVTSI